MPTEAVRDCYGTVDKCVFCSLDWLLKVDDIPEPMTAVDALIKSLNSHEGRRYVPSTRVWG